MFKIKWPLLFMCIGAAIVLFIALANKSFSFNRNISGYLTPALIGCAAGVIAGILKNIINMKQLMIENGFLGIIEALAAALDERDPYTHGHSRRVTVMALQLGIRLGMNFQETKILRLSGILHDIGKIGIADGILKKPGKLTAEEYTAIQQHPDKGARILAKVKHGEDISDIIKIVRHHHERYDGAGYPEGLRGTEIPYYSRILSLADSYDAMTSDRPYRKGMDADAAVDEIRKASGTQFDPALTSLFIEIMKSGKDTLCENSSHCPVFKNITFIEIGHAYEMQYCRSNKSACERYKIMRGKRMFRRVFCPTEVIEMKDDTT